jgi:transposase
MVFSSRAEREQYVIKLYEQGKTIREIAKEVHMSFGSIGAIIRSSKGKVASEAKGQSRPSSQIVLKREGGS